IATGKEDAVNNYAHGHRPLLSARSSLVTNKIHRLADNCSAVQSFFVFHSFGGGTSSSFSALLLKRLSTDYGKKFELKVCSVLMTLEHSDYLFIVCQKLTLVFHTYSYPSSLG
ncbi:Tubulin/FtsZ, GTPase domain-containing protein, partial [Mycena leptocephala]